MYDLQNAKNHLSKCLWTTTQRRYIFCRTEILTCKCFQMETYCFFLHSKSPESLAAIYKYICFFFQFWPVSPHLSSTACMLRQMRAFQPLIYESRTPSTLTPLRAPLAWTWTGFAQETKYATMHRFEFFIIWNILLLVRAMQNKFCCEDFVSFLSSLYLRPSSYQGSLCLLNDF